MDRVRPSILLIGDHEHREFRDATCWLREHTRLSAAASIPEALRLRPGESPSWHTVIFAQSRPGQFSRRDIEWVSREIPLAHYVALLGSLCEGEAHRGSPWPGVVRVYWHQFVGRAWAELQMDLRPTSWQLPRTASEPERVEAILGVRPHSRTGQIVVFTRSALVFDSLSSACRAVGLSTVWSANERRRSFQGAVAAIWDATDQNRLDPARMAAVAQQLGDIPLIALMAFPRYDEVETAKAHGAHRVVTCHFMLPELWNALDGV